MEHQQFIIENIPYNEVEDIIDGNIGTKVEWLDNYGKNCNRVIIRYVDEECLESALQTLYDNVVRIKEV